jgi:cytochrome c
MKKLFAILFISAVITACGGKSNKAGNRDSVTATDQTAKEAESSADTNSNKIGTEKTKALIAPGAKLIAANDCNTCHKEDVKVIGPAFVDVAVKYPPTDSNIDSLANKIIKGGKGHWGEIPMTAHPGLAVNDAKDMVRYILSLKK